MTKQQFDDLYLGKAVHCDTEEKANEFLKLAHWFGYKWSSVKSLLEKNNYHYYQEKTCYLVAKDGFEYSPEDFYIERGDEVVEFKQEKENKMKFQVGDTVRVKSDLVVGEWYGMAVFVGSMTPFKGKQVTIKRVYAEKYNIEEDISWSWTDEMLEPIEETFNVGDVVYDESGKQFEIVGKTYLIKDDDGGRFFRGESQLYKTKPLQKITRKELALKGYELVD